MKLTIMTQVTVDGVVQGNGAASDEDRRNGFERGGWAQGAGDDETRTFTRHSAEIVIQMLYGPRAWLLHKRENTLDEETYQALEQSAKEIVEIILNGIRKRK